MGAKLSTLLTISFVGILTGGCHRNSNLSMPPLELPVAMTLTQNIPQRMTFVGQTYGKADIEIPARVSGFLRSVHFKEGGFVRQGQLLYVVEPAPYAAQTAQREAAVAQAQAELTDAQLNFDRIVPLAEIHAASKSDLDQARARLKTAQASLLAAQAELDYTRIEQGYTEVRSPVSGIVGQTKARVGDFVGPGSGMAILNTVSQVDIVRVVFFIPQETFFRFEKKNRMKLSDVSLILTDNVMYPHKGHFDFFGRAVEQGTGSLAAQASFPNPDTLLRPGQFARISAVTDTLYGALLVPQVAVNRMQGVASVYALDSTDRVRQRIVSLGDTYGDLWIITSGLKSGERVVTTGFHKLHEGMQIHPLSESPKTEK